MLTLIITDLSYTDKPFTWQQEEALREYMWDTSFGINDYLLESGLPCVRSVSDDQWRAKVNRAVGYHTYIELRTAPSIASGLVGNRPGWSFGAFANSVYVSEGLRGKEYAKVLLHELVHLTRFTFSESRTNYLAFKIAYESPCPYMNRLAMEVVRDSWLGWGGDEYIATGRIIHYLEGRGAI
jgi:hypothetical protein